MADYVYVLMILSAMVPIGIANHWKLGGVHVKTSIIRSFLYVSLPFILWDVCATAVGHWSFSNQYTLGVKFFGLPLEEISFFFVIPFSCIYVWQVMKRYSNKILSKQKLLPGLVLLSSAVVVIGLLGGTYSKIVSIAYALSVVALYKSALFQSLRFWRFQLVLLGLFFAFNSILTMLPVVSYSESAIWGLRVGTIPIEDFVYNFVLINLSLLFYEKSE